MHQGYKLGYQKIFQPLRLEQFIRRYTMSQTSYGNYLQNDSVPRITFFTILK